MSFQANFIMWGCCWIWYWMATVIHQRKDGKNSCHTAVCNQGKMLLVPHLFHVRYCILPLLLPGHDLSSVSCDLVWTLALSCSVFHSDSWKKNPAIFFPVMLTIQGFILFTDHSSGIKGSLGQGLGSVLACGPVPSEQGKRILPKDYYFFLFCERVLILFWKLLR